MLSTALDFPIGKRVTDHIDHISLTICFKLVPGAVGFFQELLPNKSYQYGTDCTDRGTFNKEKS